VTGTNRPDAADATVGTEPGSRADAPGEPGAGVGGRSIRWRQPDRRAVVVTPTFEPQGELAVAVRTLAGLLAQHYRVEVAVLSGAGRPPHRDGALEVVELGAVPGDVAAAAVVGELLAEAAAATGRPHHQLPEPAATTLGGHRERSWSLLVDRLRAEPADLVVLAQPTGVGPLDLLAHLPRSTATVAVPLTGPALEDPDLLDTVRAAGAVAAVTPAEADTLAEAGVAAVEVGVHLPVNPFAVREPAAMLPAGAYVLVVDEVAAVGDSASAHAAVVPASPSAAVATAAWLQAALDPVVVAAVDGGDLVVFERGHPRRHPVVTSRSDLWRALAFARVVVAVEPGRLLARSVLEALLHATPVVAPAGTLAADHVHRSAGGLVVDTDRDRLAAVRVLVADDRAGTLGESGQAWALPRYGDLDSYRQRVATLLAAAGADRAGPGGPDPLAATAVAAR
jgi:hypothetical protein